MNRLTIREGWSTVLLTAMIVYISIWSIQRADWAAGLGILNLIALAGLIAGLVVSKARNVPSPLGHLGAFAVGAVVVLIQMTSYLDDRIGGRREKLSWLWDRGQRWSGQIWRGEQTEDLYLFVLFISSLTFLVAYATMWFVLRARWIWAALVFPGLLIFINLGYSLRVPTSYVFIYMFFALLLLARFTVLERETIWRRMRVEYPTSLAWRAMWVATYVGIFVLIFGGVFPASARSGAAHDAWLEVDGPWRSVESRFNQWFTGLRGPGRRGIGGFASFSDQFDLGGPLRLSDTPVVLLSGASSSPYLAAHRYSIYTGRGWESELSDPAGRQPDVTNQPTRQPSPQVELGVGEEVSVDEEIAERRDANEYTLEIQRPRGSLIFSPEVFSRADIGVNLVLPWRTTTNERVVIGDVDADVPLELRRLVELLEAADFSPPEPPPTPTAVSASPEASPVGATPSPTATPTPLPPAPEPRSITEERQLLATRGIQADYTIDLATYAARELIYSGEFPSFDEVEAVYAREGISRKQTYTVTALESDATSDELRATARLARPRAFNERYLQLPSTVTQRTRQLAREITAGATNQYDAAAAIEGWLRANIVYTEDIPFPPDDRDVVDFVLFDSRAGYCEYYASAFVVMARSLSIPTRMVTGFFPADRDDESDGFLYRDRNAHAWPEVYFEGYGWTPFEPTAARAAFNREPAPPGGPDPRIDDIIGGGEGGMLPDDDEFAGVLREIESGGSGGSASGTDSDSVSRVEWAARGGVLSLMALTLLVVFLWLRGMRGLTPVAQLYGKLSRGASWGGIRPDPSMTPNEYARELARAVPGSRSPASFLADLYVRETYGSRPPAQADMLRARQAWLRLRGLLVKHFFSRLRPWRPAAIDGGEDDDW